MSKCGCEYDFKMVTISSVFEGLSRRAYRKIKVKSCALHPRKGKYE